MSNPAFPLAFGRDGNPIVLPADAVAWRVDWAPGRQKSTRVPGEDGSPLRVPLETSGLELAQLLAELGEEPGRYELVPLAADNSALPDVETAIWHFRPVRTREEPQSFDRTLTSSMADRLVETNKVLCTTVQAAVVPRHVHPLELFAGRSDDDDDESGGDSRELMWHAVYELSKHAPAIAERFTQALPFLLQKGKPS